MATYIFRRLLTAILILFGASYIVYLLIAYSGDPLAELRASNSPSKEAQIQLKTAYLHLDVPPPLRYFIWFRGAIKCVVPFAQQCDLGRSVNGQPVTNALSHAIPTSLQLVTGALVLAVIIGITVGIVTALRQYSALRLLA